MVKVKGETVGLITLALAIAIPIAYEFGEEVGQVALVVFIVYGSCLLLWSIVSFFKDRFESDGVGTTVFRSWLYLSMLAGLVAVYGVIRSGLDDMPWAGVVVVYALVVGVAFRKKFKD